MAKVSGIGGGTGVEAAEGEVAGMVADREIGAAGDGNQVSPRAVKRRKRRLAAWLNQNLQVDRRLGKGAREVAPGRVRGRHDLRGVGGEAERESQRMELGC